MTFWGSCRIHNTWNFSQGNLFRFEVSGLNINVGRLSDFNLIRNTLISDGSFGP